MYKYTYINPIYTIMEINRLYLSPARIATDFIMDFLNSPYNILHDTSISKTLKANLEITDRITRQYEKPEFGIIETEIQNKKYVIAQETILKKTFCHLIHFRKINIEKKLPKLLIVAPMAGHHATLLRSTVKELLPYNDVYITDWISACQVPVSKGSFNMDDYIDYIIEFLNLIGNNTHVLAVCQPTVPVLAAVSIMADEKNQAIPKSMIMMGGPIDARKSPTSVNLFATSKSIEWFEHFVITSVPANYPGFTRKVYPGFLQLAGFISMNLQKHIDSHIEMYKHLLVEDEPDNIEQVKFYDEYLSVMDLPAEFYLQTIKEVFHQFAIAKHQMVSRGRKVDTSKIKDVSILGIEGEFDDIAGIGQTAAVLNLCNNVDESRKQYHLQKGVGHYGIFSGSKFRKEIVPVIVDFITKWD